MTHSPLPTAEATANLAGPTSTTSNYVVKPDASAGPGLLKSPVAPEPGGSDLAVATLPEQLEQPSHDLQETNEEDTEEENSEPEHLKRWEQAAAILALAALRAEGIKVPQATSATPTT